MRDMKKLFIFTLTLLRLASAFAAPSPAQKPDVILILVDDMGWSDPSCYGGKVHTPNMDRLATEGGRFTRFYTASPICSASRCGIITGQFPARWRITSYLQTRAGNRECEQADFLDPRAPLMPRTFKDAGYATAHIGKWHLGGGRDVTDAPKFAAYGYDVGLGTYESPEPAAALGLKSMPWSKETEPQQVKRHDRTRWMVDQTIAFLKAHDSPCFVNLWLDDVHTPYVPSDEQREHAGDGPGTPEYRAVLIETDRQIGRLLDALREMKRDDHTLILIAGDNGPQPSFDGARCGGLRGMKWSLFEGGVRTPLIMRLPGLIPPGTVNDATVISAVDLFPTLCTITQIEAPPGVAFDGEDMSDVLKGSTRTRTKPLLWEYGRKPAKPGAPKDLRAFPYPGEPNAVSPNVSIRDGNWKLLINADGTDAQLYNLATDPRETKNLIDTETGTATLMKTQALDWRKSLP